VSLLVACSTIPLAPVVADASAPAPELVKIATNRDDVGRGVTIYGGVIYVWTGGDLARPFLGSRYDAFVRSLTPSGDTVWTRQFGSQQQDRALGIVATDRGVVVAGRTRGRLPGQSLAGLEDGFLREYSLRGRHRWTDQFGTTRSDSAVAAVLDGSEVVTLGLTDVGDSTSYSHFDIAVWEHTSAGQAGGTLTFGSPSTDSPGGIALLGDRAYIVGTTSGDPGSIGGDAFLAEVPLPVGS
jgi:hypothetical protein